MSEFVLKKKQKRYLRAKRTTDVILSGGAIVLLSPLLGAISLAIKLDSPGPILFKQQRVGKDKELFEIWKFRSMRADTPKDIPTHMLDDPDAFITRTGKFLRRTSLDELPQIFNILRGQMSIVGPRPALWNQDDLVAERDKYGVNSLTPGLTGWAQINGRDELEIPVKAKFDGEYIEKMGLRMDLTCFLATIGSVLTHDGVKEGGTGEMHKEGAKTGDGSELLVSPEKIKREVTIGAVAVGITGAVGTGVLTAIGKHTFGKKNVVPRSGNSHRGLKVLGITMAGAAAVTAGLYVRSRRKMIGYQRVFRHDSKKVPKVKNAEIKAAKKKVLITGANSYVGMAVENWLGRTPDQYQVDTLNMRGEEWKSYDFSPYDVIFHVAGIVHVTVDASLAEQEKTYEEVNTKLAIKTVEIAKEAGVKQFIFMSTMSVYGGCDEKTITLNTEPNPINFYGKSKWEAEQKIKKFGNESFKVVILRPPMIYGKNCKGNYVELSKLAYKLPCFPEVKNQRSMLYIDNLCQFVKLIIDNEESGIFFPQNAEYTNTSEMVQMIAAVKGRTIIMIPGMGGPVKLMERMPGRIGELIDKAFGDLRYDMSMSEYKEDYRVCTLDESIWVTELETKKSLQ